MSVSFKIQYDYCSEDKRQDLHHTIMVFWSPWREPIWRLVGFEQVDYAHDGSKIVGGRKLVERDSELEGLDAFLHLHKQSDVLRAIKQEVVRRVTEFEPLEIKGGAA